MKITSTELPGVMVLEPTTHEDDRGLFFESYRESVLAAHGIHAHFVQENCSVSKRHVLRGLHYQLRHPQAKLCHVVAGAVLDVAVDIRQGSPSFGQHVKVQLSAENRRRLFVPRGFAHGILALTEEAQFVYKCDDVYRPDDCRGIAWNDTSLRIDWGSNVPLLSSVDQTLPVLSDISFQDFPKYER